MGLGHWIGKRLGISRDLTKTEIRNLLGEIKRAMELLAELKAKNVSYYGKPLYDIPNEKYGVPFYGALEKLGMLTSTTSRQDRAKLRKLKELLTTGFAPFEYNPSTSNVGNRIIQFQQIPLIKAEIDRLLKEEFIL